MALTRLLAHRGVPELAALWLVELVALFLALDMLQIAGAWDISAATRADSLIAAAVIASIMGFTSLSIGLYRADICTGYRRLIISALLASMIGGEIIYVIAPLLAGGAHVAPVQLVAAPLLWPVFLLFSRASLSTMLRQRLFGRRVMVIGDGPRATGLARAIQDVRGGRFEVVQDYPEVLALTPASLRAQRILAVVVTDDIPDRITVRATQACQRAGIRVYDDSSFWEQQLGRVDLQHVDPCWFATREHGLAGMLHATFRRLADIGTSLGLLAFTLPIMVLTVIAIRLDSAGPVFYRQTRIGLLGRHFTLLKFRSMRVDAEEGGRARWASEDDPRITRVGDFIRRTRIDELPQLFNVLRGEMSFIGPRPERPEFVSELSAAIPPYPHRACVKPGITGWAQVNYPYGASVEDARQKLSYDLFYIKYRSLLLDLLILIATIRVVLFREGSR